VFSNGLWATKDFSAIIQSTVVELLRQKERPITMKFSDFSRCYFLN
jgi:hypothetical protein